MSDVIIQLPTKRRVVWDRDSSSKPSEQIIVQVKNNQVTVKGPDHQKVVVKGKSANGHKVNKKRELRDPERLKIKKFFLLKNGVIGEDDLKGLCEDEVSIFQVTGYVSLLHRLVASGTLKLPGHKTYEKHIKTRRNLWATYDSPKYKALRSMLTKGA